MHEEDSEAWGWGVRHWHWGHGSSVLEPESTCAGFLDIGYQDSGKRGLVYVPVIMRVVGMLGPYAHEM